MPPYDGSRLTHSETSSPNPPRSPPFWRSRIKTQTSELRGSPRSTARGTPPGRAARQCLADADAAVRRAALTLLAHNGALPDRTLLADDDPTVRAQAAALLLDHDGDARLTLLRAASDPNSGVRAGTLRGVAAARVGDTLSTARAALGAPGAG